MTSPDPQFCEYCATLGERTKMNSDCKCPKCNWEPKSGAEVFGMFATMPITLPLAAIADMTKSPKVERAVRNIGIAGAEMAGEILPDVGKAALAGVALYATSKIWKVFTKKA